MKKIILVSIAAFTLGFLTNYFLKQDPPSENISLIQAKKDLVSISQKEYLEYTQIKDLKEKYEKADELLGKVMLLFLADIGFRAKLVPADELQTPSVEVVKNIEPVPTAIPAVPTQVLQPETLPVQNVRPHSGVIRNLKTPAQITEALNQALIENPRMEVMNGNYPSNRIFKVLEGIFIGNINFIDTKRETLDVAWTLTPNYNKRPPEAQFELKITGPETNSNSRGRGQLKHVSTMASDPEAILVEGCGDRCYMQMYYNSVQDGFYGNYYERKGSSKKFERTGYVHLHR